MISSKKLVITTLLVSIILINCQNKQKQQKTTETKGEIFASIGEDLEETKCSEYIVWEKESVPLHYNKPLNITFNEKKQHAFILTLNSQKKTYITITYKSGTIDAIDSMLVSLNAIENREHFKGHEKEWKHSTRLSQKPGSKNIYIIKSTQNGSVAITLHN